MAYIIDMGGMKSSECNSITKLIWNWAAEVGIWISVAHIPGSDNILADKASRVFHNPTEWSLDNEVYLRVIDRFGKPEIDLFASRLNYKVIEYASWKPDPKAKFIDAFSVNWFKFGRLCRGDIDCAVVAQPWFPKVMRMLIDCPVLLPLNVLSLPYSEERHPLRDKLRLLACRLSGRPIKSEAYRTPLLRSSYIPGESPLDFSMKVILTNGLISAVDGTLIQVFAMKTK